MRSNQIIEILKKINKVKIAVYGDFCLDAYWIMDPGGSEISVETGLQAEAVRKHYYSPGGASNIVANLSALKPASIKVIGVIGDDLFGRELTLQLVSLNADISSLIVQKENFSTITFTKKYLEENEEPRIDFGFFNERSEETDKKILKNLRVALQNYDALIFNQQVPRSITNEEFINEINTLFKEFENKIILLDSRHYNDKFNNVFRKTNDIEIARLNGVDLNPNDIVSTTDIKRYAKNIYKQSKKPIFITRGSRGILTIDSEGVSEIPGIQLLTKLDPVGAGDTIISALVLCLAAGIKPRDAAIFANFAAAVTVQKLFTTGTASGEEILEISKDPDYIYQPELAEDLRRANYLSGTDIELCYSEGIKRTGKIKHAVFDHDGTISTIRLGWETIMEPVMINAILGDKYKIASETLYHRVRKRVIDYINKSTGVQTIVQMEGLIKMVEEFNIVPKDNILDKFGYKKKYNDALMEMVNKRLTRFNKGELDINDYTIKGAVRFLQALSDRDVKLYLASGTDQEDVLNEARLLGYADLFDGGIYGSVGDVSKYSKKIVIEKIIKKNNLKGSELVVFGDGPVEIRECRKHEGIAIGIASNEIRRYGLNPDKRTRLIKAGAHIIAPDFSQFEDLINLLFNYG
ncbi:MAG: HAD family hydrolase [Bacteroidales bacterium]|nr:HAD family hydrolase [Bacteroidales bacterium]